MLGYQLRYKVLSATDHGSPVVQKRLIVVGFQESSSVDPALPPLGLEDPGVAKSRPMANCL